MKNENEEIYLAEVDPDLQNPQFLIQLEATIGIINLLQPKDENDDYPDSLIWESLAVADQLEA